MKLTDTQLVVLSVASNRDDGSILPLPANLKGGAATKVLDGLIRRGLAERLDSDRPGAPDLVRVTLVGLEAIGVAADTPAKTGNPDGPGRAKKPATKSRNAKRRKAAAKGRDPANAPRAGTKQALLTDMLRRKDGATIDQIAEATGWQRHTVRGAIAGAVKKKLGLTVESEKVEDRGRVYKIADGD